MEAFKRPDIKSSLRMGDPKYSHAYWHGYFEATAMEYREAIVKAHELLSHALTAPLLPDEQKESLESLRDFLSLYLESEDV